MYRATKTHASHSDNFPSARNTRLKLAAIMKKQTSRTKLLRPTLNGLTNAMEPAITAVMKLAAPISSPTARLPLLVLMAAKVEKMSGLPLPKAKNVTPARLSLMPSSFAIVLRLTEKKSLAAIPMVLKSNPSHNAIIPKATGCAPDRAQ